jgi:hypothetical protein
MIGQTLALGLKGLCASLSPPSVPMCGIGQTLIRPTNSA